MLTIGMTIQNRYRVVSVLGKGGMGHVYLCSDTRFPSKRWALKEMISDLTDPNQQKTALEQFKSEAQLLAVLEHPFLPKVVDYFQEGSNFYLVMEYVDGRNLEKIISQSKTPLPENQVVRLGVHIATVLYFLHKQNPPIIFRDLKPSNIMVTEEGNVKLIDFGIARFFKENKRQDTVRIGSLGYAPPEQYGLSQTDPRSDIYALGVTLYYLLTKLDPATLEEPFKFPPLQQLNKKVSRQTAEVITKAMSLDPDMRYTTALEMKKALQSTPSFAVTTHASKEITETQHQTTTTIPEKKKKNMPENKTFWQKIKRTASIIMQTIVFLIFLAGLGFIYLLFTNQIYFRFL